MNIPRLHTRAEIEAAASIRRAELRDKFALAALQSPVIAHAYLETPKPEGRTPGQHIAIIVYAIADHILAERVAAKQEKPE